MPRQHAILHRLLVALALFCLAPAMALAASGDPVTFTIIAQQPGTGPYGYATTMAKFMKDVLPEGSTINIIPRGGSMANPTTLNMGKGDVGIATTSSMQWAWDGMPEVYGKQGPHKEIRQLSLGLMNINYTFVAARKTYVEATGNDTLEKVLNAKELPRIAIKPPGSVVPPIYREMIKFMGKNFDDIQKSGKLIQVQPSQVGEMLRDGRVDVYFECTTLNHPSVTEIALTNDLVFLPLPTNLSEQMNGIGMPTVVMKAGGYRGLNEDYPTYATGNNIIAWSGASEEAVYLLTKSIIERREEFIEDNPQMRTWDPENDHEITGTVPLHPGAERYYREIGWVK